jgi:membrane protease YdiL (CAAX protease family)
MTRDLIIFFAVAYALAWLVFIPLVIWQAQPEWIVVGSFSPTVAALVAHRMATGSFRAVRFVTSWPRTLGGTAVAIILVIVSYVVLPAVMTADPRRLRWSVLASLAVYNYSTLLGGPLGEEPGWRGYALPRLERVLSPVRASLVLALLWVGWHIPLFFYPGWTSSPLWVYVVFLTGQSIILTFATNLAGFGVIAPIAGHAMFNTVSRFLAGLFRDTRPTAPVRFELVMALSGLAVAAIIVVLTRGRLGYREPSPQPPPSAPPYTAA